MKRKFDDKYVGQDKLVGRPIRLNKVNLNLNEKGEANLLFWGDIHYGHPQAQLKKAIQMLEWARNKNANIILMGDLIESGTRESVGDSVYKQKLNPQEQMEKMVEILMPYKDLIIGLHEGNHENRITKMTSIDVSKIMARLLGISYLGYACWNLLRVGKINYTMYSTHGSSGSRFKHTKMKAVMDLVQWIKADIIAMGHVHSIASEPVIYQEVDFRNKTVVEKKCYVVLTGSYIGWDKSYAQMKNMPITKLGSPRARFASDKKDVHFSL